MDSSEFDVVVVGGGAAGMSASLVLGRARRRVAVVDAGAPRNAAASHMHGFLSRDGMSPVDLLDVGRKEAASYGVTFIRGKVTSVDLGFTIYLEGDRTLQAKRLLITTGATDELPSIPGLRERWGRDFLHCPYCHGWEVRDQALAILSTGNGSIAHAQLIRQWSDDLIFLTHIYELTEIERAQLDACGIRIVDGDVRELVVQDDRLRGVVLADGRTVMRDALFVRPNIRPRHAFLEQLDCDVDDLGFLRVDREGRTSTAGVWAAGNAANPRAQVITAAGEGSAAAISINANLVEEDVRDALHARSAGSPRHQGG